MRTIQWKVVVTKNNIASMETAIGLPKDEIESHLLIIGLLENLKQKHLDKLQTLFEETKKGEEANTNL